MHFLKTSDPLQKLALSVTLQHFKQARDTMYTIILDYLCKQFCKRKMFLNGDWAEFGFDIQTLDFFFTYFFFYYCLCPEAIAFPS